MTELGEKVFNNANEWWIDAALQGNVKVTDLIKKTIELTEDAFNIQYKYRIDERIEEIAMERAKDINGIPVRTLIAKDILNTMINRQCVEASNKELAEAAVDLTDELLKALKR